MKKFILIVIGLTSSILVNAQSFLDNALLFSRTSPGGSARIQAIGGTQVSLGGDYSSAFSNAAGLGMYNRNEFTFTPALNFSNSTSEYFGMREKDSKANFNLSGLSLVFNYPSQRESGFLGGSFGVSLTRINDFNQDYRYSGVNNQNSIINYFLEDANGVYFDNEILDPAEMKSGGDNFYNLTALAFHNYLIDTLRDENGNLFYDSPITFYKGANGSIEQREISERRGAQYQWSLSYGANFSDKFFVGATLGITSIRFKQRQTFREYNFDLSAVPTGVNLDPDHFEIEENYNISGGGVNFGAGVIYRPIDIVQFGVSIVTPTFYQLTDTYDASIVSDWNGYDYYEDESFIINEESKSFDEPLVSEYNLTTPMRINTGATLISKIGFISADVEFLNYGKARYTSDISEGFEPENADIKGEYESVINYRVGAEYRFESYRVRAGLNYMSDPLITNNVDRSQTGFSGGLGYRGKNFFIDIAAVFTQTKGRRVPYFVAGDDPVAKQRFRNMNYILTTGFTF